MRIGTAGAATEVRPPPFGCLVGMVPLLFMDPDAAQRKKSEEKRKRVILRAVEYLPDLLDAEAAVIMMVDPERPDELHSIGEGTLPSFRSDRSVGKFISVSCFSEIQF